MVIIGYNGLIKNVLLLMMMIVNGLIVSLAKRYLILQLLKEC